MSLVKAFFLTTVAFAASQAVAQTVADGAPKDASTESAADKNGLETVVVSAQRRNEVIQKAPLSITAISAKDMEIKQIRRLDDMKFEVPNLVIEQNTGTSSGAKIFMRGVGTDESLFTADPSVAIYIDDMYIARQTALCLTCLIWRELKSCVDHRVHFMVETQPAVRCAMSPRNPLVSRSWRLKAVWATLGALM